MDWITTCTMEGGQSAYSKFTDLNNGVKGKQDGRVEGLDATSSQENMKITITEHPSTKKTATYQKKIFYIQKQRINHNKQVGGTYSWYD